MTAVYTGYRECPFSFPCQQGLLRALNETGVLLVEEPCSQEQGRAEEEGASVLRGQGGGCGLERSQEG